MVFFHLKKKERKEQKEEERLKSELEENEKVSLWQKNQTDWGTISMRYSAKGDLNNVSVTFSALLNQSSEGDPLISFSKLRCKKEKKKKKKKIATKG